MGLNRAGLLTGGFFSIANTTLLHDPRLVESNRCEFRCELGIMDVQETRIQKNWTNGP